MRVMLVAPVPVRVVEVVVAAGVILYFTPPGLLGVTQVAPPATRAMARLGVSEAQVPLMLAMLVRMVVMLTLLGLVTPELRVIPDPQGEHLRGYARLSPAAAAAQGGAAVRLALIAQVVLAVAVAVRPLRILAPLVVFTIILVRGPGEIRVPSEGERALPAITSVTLAAAVREIPTPQAEGHPVITFLVLVLEEPGALMLPTVAVAVAAGVVVPPLQPVIRVIRVIRVLIQTQARLIARQLARVALMPSRWVLPGGRLQFLGTHSNE